MVKQKHNWLHVEQFSIHFAALSPAQWFMECFQLDVAMIYNFLWGTSDARTFSWIAPTATPRWCHYINTWFGNVLRWTWQWFSLTIYKKKLKKIKAVWRRTIPINYIIPFIPIFFSSLFAQPRKRCMQRISIFIHEIVVPTWESDSVPFYHLVPFRTKSHYNCVLQY